MLDCAVPAAVSLLMKHIILVNPNTSHAITADMVEIARGAAPAGVRISGLTVRFGAPLITDEAALDEAARAVLALAPELGEADGVIVSAFGDPGADALSERLARPVVGIAEASMRAAARDGRRFAVVTTTPLLVPSILQRSARIGLGQLCGGVLTTPGDPAALMAKPGDLERALHELAERAVAELDAEAIIVGGGPLARVGTALRARLSVPVIEPIPEAVFHLFARLGAASTR
jgi:allantoin racemase